MKTKMNSSLVPVNGFLQRRIASSVHGSNARMQQFTSADGKCPTANIGPKLPKRSAFLPPSALTAALERARKRVPFLGSSSVFMASDRQRADLDRAVQARPYHGILYDGPVTKG